MGKLIITAIVVSVLSACAAGYNPNNAAPSVQAQMRNANPDSLHCPAGSVAACDIEGGGLVGKRYSNCRCAR